MAKKSSIKSTKAPKRWLQQGLKPLPDIQLDGIINDLFEDMGNPTKAQLVETVGYVMQQHFQAVNAFNMLHGELILWLVQTMFAPGKVTRDKVLESCNAMLSKAKHINENRYSNAMYDEVPPLDVNYTVDRVLSLVDKCLMTDVELFKRLDWGEGEVRSTKEVSEALRWPVSRVYELLSGMAQLGKLDRYGYRLGPGQWADVDDKKAPRKQSLGWQRPL